MRSYARQFRLCLGVIAALAVVSASVLGADSSTASSSSTTTTEAIDYNNVRCFTDAGCMMPLRGPPYCQNGVAVRDVKYGTCENGGTEAARCVSKTNVTVVAECGSGQRCQGGRCLADGSQMPPDAVAEVVTTTSTTLRGDTSPMQPLPTPSTSMITTTSTVQSVNKADAVPSQSAPSNLVWAVVFAVLGLLFLAMIVTAALILYFVFKRRGGGGQASNSSIYSNGGRSALNVKYLR
ncbi:MAG: hypothetical protein V1875_00350 [Candidatus Altiarchaeota archaeon]